MKSCDVAKRISRVEFRQTLVPWSTVEVNGY